jgi:hypothetical protein
MVTRLALAIASHYQPDTHQQYLVAQVRGWFDAVLCCHAHQRLPVVCDLSTGCRVLLPARHLPAVPCCTGVRLAAARVVLLCAPVAPRSVCRALGVTGRVLGAPVVANRCFPKYCTSRPAPTISA